MSNLKHKEGDRFTHKETTSEIYVDRVDFEGDEKPYLIRWVDNTSNFVSEDWIDKHFNKLELNKAPIHYWENPNEGNKTTSDFEKIFFSACKMVEAKDKNYGNAALSPLDIFSKHHPYGSRLDEKLARVKNCDNLRKNDVADLIGGLALICKSKGWTNFDDQID